MRTYNLKITETLSQIVKVEANSFAEAIEKLEKMYRKEEIVLDYSDFEGYEIYQVTEVKKE